MRHGLLLLAFLLAACGSDEATPPLPAPPVVEADTPLGPEPREAAPEIPTDSVVTPDVPTPPIPAEKPPIADLPAPAPDARPDPPLVTQPGEPAPRPDPPPSTDRTAVEAFWTQFQAALRARDADRIDDFLASTVRVGGEAYDRDGPQVQEVVRQFAENPDLTDAYLETSADALQVDGDRATFASTARYTIGDEPYEVVVSGVLREVEPGTWRIVELASETAP